ncbi:Glutathione S-transferase 1:-like isoform C [Dinothrombium tinctorium]|uniref:Glutathione S-transferase 1:-like isoform C n=1 Tax=Dinothrombium tinctorium TaxID=1965070 RepID=A0A3S3NCU9_9ACAR|nr:Glutathione S-transferase 1:-like isoform C [Dinothrombium tinctorium]
MADEKAKIDFYYTPESAPCRAVLMTAKHLAIDLNLIEIDLNQKQHLTELFFKMNPFHCVPTINDNGFVLWESRAIMQYFVNKYFPNHQLYPREAAKRATVDRLLFFDIGTLYKALRDYIHPIVHENKRDEIAESRLWDKMKFLDTFLKNKHFVAGDQLTLADLSLLASVTSAEIIDYNFSQFPNVINWIRKLKLELPYYEEVNGKPLREAKQRFKSSQ